MLTSIVLLASQRVELLKRNLDSLWPFLRVRKDWELLLVANGANEEVSCLLESFSRRDDRISLIKTHPQFPGAARNRAASIARGDILYFVDDDVEFFQDPLSALNRIFSHSQVLVAGGANLTPPNSSSWARASGICFSLPWVMADKYKRYSQSNGGRFVGEESLILCNLAVRRNIFTQIGFPSQFFCGEENVFLQSLPRLANSMWYDPKLSVYHARREGFAGLFLQCFNYGWGRAQGAKQMSDGKFLLHAVPALSLICALFAPFIKAAFLKILFAMYFLTMMASSLAAVFKRESLGVSLLALVIVPTIHVGYGLGFLGCLARNLKEVGRNVWQRVVSSF